MAHTPRDLITSLGGYRTVADRIGKKPTSVHSQMQSGVLPAAWYDIICHLAREDGLPEPPRSMFGFLRSPDEGGERLEEGAA